MRFQQKVTLSYEFSIFVPFIKISFDRLIEISDGDDVDGSALSYLEKTYHPKKP